MVRVRRWVDSNKVYQMCNKYQYYTSGDCRAYDRMLANARDVDADNLEEVLQIAIDIVDHTGRFGEDDNAYEYFVSTRYKDDVEGVMHAILTECVDLYVEWDR